jgi:hypothetical protein
LIWDAARPDSSPEIEDSGKFERFEHVIGNRAAEPAIARGRLRLYPLERLVAP